MDVTYKIFLFVLLFLTGVSGRSRILEKPEHNIGSGAKTILEFDAEELGCGDSEIEINLKPDVFGSGGLLEDVESGEKDQIEIDEELTGSGHKGTTTTVIGSGDRGKETDTEEIGSSGQETIKPTANDVDQEHEDGEVELGEYILF